jgi:hypothetical protein
MAKHFLVAQLIQAFDVPLTEAMSIRLKIHTGCHRTQEQQSIVRELVGAKAAAAVVVGDIPYFQT